MAEMSCDLIEAGLDWRYTPSRIAALIGEHDTMALVASEGPHILGFAIMHFGDDEAHSCCCACGRRSDAVASAAASSTG